MSYKKINTTEELIEDCSNDVKDYFILLGNFKSSKTISYDVEHKIFYIHHDIDGEDEELTKKELETSSTGTSILSGSFYKYL